MGHWCISAICELRNLQISGSALCNLGICRLTVNLQIAYTICRLRKIADIIWKFVLQPCQPLASFTDCVMIVIKIYKLQGHTVNKTDIKTDYQFGHLSPWVPPYLLSRRKISRFSSKTTNYQVGCGKQWICTFVILLALISSKSHSSEYIFLSGRILHTYTVIQIFEHYFNENLSLLECSKLSYNYTVALFSSKSSLTCPCMQLWFGVSVLT